MEELAKTNLNNFLYLLNSDKCSITMMTFGIEIAAEYCVNSMELENLIYKYLDHSNAVVREGAFYAIEKYYSKIPVDLILKIKDIYINDSSRVIRELAKELLLNYQENDEFVKMFDLLR